MNRPPHYFGCGYSEQQARVIMSMLNSAMNALELCDFCKLNLLQSMVCNILREMEYPETAQAHIDYSKQIAILLDAEEAKKK